MRGRGSLFSKTAHRSEGKVVSNMLPKYKFFFGLVKDGFKFIEKFEMKSVGMTEPKQMATFIALGDIVTASLFERESFVSWAELEDAFKKTWCTKLDTSDAIAIASQNHQKKMGVSFIVSSF